MPMNRSLGLLNTKRLKRVLARAVACSLLLILPSCGIPYLRKADPGPGLPETFNGVASPDNSAQVGIKEFFNDPLLTCLMGQALDNNRELRILNEEIQVAGAEVLARQ